MIKESDAAQFHHRQIISRRFVVTRSDAAVFFQATKAPLNDVAIAIDQAVLVHPMPFFHLIFGGGGLPLSLYFQLVAQCVSGVRFVGQHNMTTAFYATVLTLNANAVQKLLRELAFMRLPGA